LIWNRRLYQAVKAGDEDLAKALRQQMNDQGILEFAYKPLSEGNKDALARVVDRLHQDFEAATDMTTKEEIAQKIADAQALINHSEGGGYFSGGGVREWVSERPGQPAESRFPRPPGAEHLGVPAAEKLGNALDQLAKLDHSLEGLAEGGAHAIDGVRGIGKYGERLAKALEQAGAYNAKEWESLLAQCKKLKAAADAGEVGTRMAAGEAEAVAQEARRLFDQLIEQSDAALKQMRSTAGIEQIGDVMAKLQAATLAHVRLLRAADMTLSNIWALIRTAAKLGQQTAAGPPEQ
jgi:hypothetical protein